MDSSYSAQEETGPGHSFAPRSIVDPARQQQHTQRRSAYKDLISLIAESLTPADVGNIVWQYDLPHKMKHDSPLDVLAYLHRRQNSSFNECNIGSLEELLKKINHQELVTSKLKQYEEQFGATMTRPISYSMPPGVVNPRVPLEKRPVSYHGQSSNSNLSTSNVSQIPVNYENTPYQETVQSRETLGSIPDPGIGQLPLDLQSSGHSQSYQRDVLGSGVYQEQVGTLDHQSSYSEASLQHGNQPVQYIPQHNNVQYDHTVPQQQQPVVDVYQSVHPQLQSYSQSPRANDGRQRRRHNHAYSEELSLPIDISTHTLPQGMLRRNPSSQSLPQRANNYYNDPRHGHSISHFELPPMPQSRVPAANQSYFYPQHTLTTHAHNTSTPLVNRPKTAPGRPPSLGYHHEGRPMRSSSVSGHVHEVPSYARYWYNTSQDSILDDQHLSHSSGFASSGDMMMDHFPPHMIRRQSLPPKPTYIFRGVHNNTYQQAMSSQDYLLTNPQYYDVNSNSMSSTEGHYSHSGGPMDYPRQGQVAYHYDHSPPAIGDLRFGRSFTAGPVLSYRREGSVARVQTGDIYPEDIQNPPVSNDFRREPMMIFDRSNSRSPYSSPFPQYYSEDDHRQAPGPDTDLRIKEQDEHTFEAPPVLDTVDNSHDKYQSKEDVLSSGKDKYQDTTSSKPARYDEEHVNHAELNTNANSMVCPEANKEEEEVDLSECEDYPQPVLRRSSCNKHYAQRRWSSLEQRDKKNIFKTSHRLSLHSVDKSSSGSLMDAHSPEGTPLHKQASSSKSSLDDVCETSKPSARKTSKNLKKTPFTRNWFSIVRSKLVTPGQELIWQEKVEDINKLIYKSKYRGKYLTCPWKIEVDGKGQPNPKLLLHLHPYGLEEDENRNVTFEVAIEQPKRHRLHSTAKLSVQLSAEDDKHKRQLGKTYRATKDLKLSFFYIKGFISHEDLKQSRSDNVVIKVRVEMLLEK